MIAWLPVTYEEASRLKRGDTIDYLTRNRVTITGKVTGRVHRYPERGRIVYVPVDGLLIHNERILRKVDA